MSKQRSFIIALSGLHVRKAEGEEESRTVEGHAAVFGQRSINLTPRSSYREIYEVMEPGSISEELLRNSDVLLLYEHDPEKVLGRWRYADPNSTLKLSLDGKGLLATCDVAKTTYGDNALESIRRGDVFSMSFAFTDDSEDSENGVSYERLAEKSAKGKEVWIRHVKKVTGLYDVSIVARPAYEQTDVSNRDAEDAEKELAGAIDAQEKADAEKRAAEQKKARERNIAAMMREIEIAEEEIDF